MAAQHTFVTIGDKLNSQCGRKVGHPNLETASREAARLEAIERVKFNAYACGWCGKFHVGHAQKPTGAGGPNGERRGLRKDKKQQRRKTGKRSANIQSVFQSRRLEFAKIRGGRPLQGGRIESNRKRH